MALVQQRIIEDLFAATTEGIRGVDHDGRPICLFIDTVAIMGDLPQAAAFTDVLGHSTDTLCRLFYMRKHKNHTFQEKNHSSQQHSGRLTLVRFDARRKAKW